MSKPRMRAVSRRCFRAIEQSYDTIRSWDHVAEQIDQWAQSYWHGRPVLKKDETMPTLMTRPTLQEAHSGVPVSEPKALLLEAWSWTQPSSVRRCWRDNTGAPTALAEGYRVEGEWVNSVDAYAWLRQLAKRSVTERATLVHYSAGWTKTLLLELLSDQTTVDLYTCRPSKAAGYGQCLRILEFFANLVAELRLYEAGTDAVLNVYFYDDNPSSRRLCMLDEDVIVLGRYDKKLMQMPKGVPGVRGEVAQIIGHSEPCIVYTPLHPKLEETRIDAKRILESTKKTASASPDLCFRYGEFDKYPTEELAIGRERLMEFLKEQ